MVPSKVGVEISTPPVQWSSAFSMRSDYNGLSKFYNESAITQYLMHLHIHILPLLYFYLLWAFALFLLFSYLGKKFREEMNISSEIGIKMWPKNDIDTALFAGVWVQLLVYQKAVPSILMKNIPSTDST